MRPVLFVSLGLFLAVEGCGKRTEQPPANPPAQSEQGTNLNGQAEAAPRSVPAPSRPPATAPLPAPTPVVAARSENLVREHVVGDVDATLTEQLRSFVQQNQRLPGNFAEFALKRLDTIPRPPQGKRWVIDGATLEVKAVPAQ